MGFARNVMAKRFSFALITGGQGNVSTETMRAFSETEFERLLKTLP